jgi:hypothetical protein
MATVLQGVLTNKGREFIAKSFGNIGGFNMCRIVKFAYGEGGWVTSPSGGRSPKLPDPALTDIEAKTTATAPDNYYFEKVIGASDVTFVMPSTIEFRCKLNPTDANDDGYGNPPKFFELGLYDDFGNMIAYTTFDEQTKTETKSLITYVQVVF